jgi:mRNA-degrading endonuclease toxin of MazEF toxin-antitoxin module
MDKYDVFELTGGRGKPASGLVVVLQHRLLEDLQTMVVAPLDEPRATEKAPRLRPTVQVAGKSFQVQIDRLAAIDKKLLGRRIGDVLAESDRVDVAIAMLLNGF